jgi:hypothetical protein
MEKATTRKKNSAFRTDRIEIIDSRGAVRAELGMDDEDGVALRFFAKDGALRSALRIDGDGDPQFGMGGARNPMRLMMAVNQEGMPVFTMTGENGGVLFSVCNYPMTGPVIQVREGAETGDPIRLMDFSGGYGAGLGISPEGAEPAGRNGTRQHAQAVQAAATL